MSKLTDRQREALLQAASVGTAELREYRAVTISKLVTLELITTDAEYSFTITPAGVEWVRENAPGEPIAECHLSREQIISDTAPEDSTPFLPGGQFTAGQRVMYVVPRDGGPWVENGATQTSTGRVLGEYLSAEVHGFRIPHVSVTNWLTGKPASVTLPMLVELTRNSTEAELAAASTALHSAMQRLYPKAYATAERADLNRELAIELDQAQTVTGPLADFGRDFPNVERVLTETVPFVAHELYPTDYAFVMLIVGTSDRLNPVTGQPMVWITYRDQPGLPPVEVDPEFYTALPQPKLLRVATGAACCSLWTRGVDCGCADAKADRLTGFEPEDDEAEFNALVDEYDPAAARRERDAGPVPFSAHARLYRLPTGEAFIVLGSVTRDAVDYPTVPGTPGVYLRPEGDPSARPVAVFEPALSTCFTGRMARKAYVVDRDDVLYTVDGPTYDEFGNARMHLTDALTFAARTPKLGNFNRRFRATCWYRCPAAECQHRGRWTEPRARVADPERARRLAVQEGLMRAVLVGTEAALRALSEGLRLRFAAAVPQGRVFFVDAVTGERLYRGVRIPPRADFVPRPTGRGSAADLSAQALGRGLRPGWLTGEREQGPCRFGDACEVHGRKVDFLSDVLSPAEREREAFWQELWTLAGGRGRLHPWQLAMLRTLDNGPFPTLKRDDPGYHGSTM